jgi:hypothetical protein
MGLVQGTAPQEVPYTRYIAHLFPAEFGDGAPQTVASPPGVITLMIKRCTDDYAPAAVNGFSLRANETVR